MPVTLKYVQEYRNRHGKVYRYFRKPGQRKIALHGEPGSAKFMAAYSAALAGLELSAEKQKLDFSTGSISATIAAYYTDNSFLRLAQGTQKMRRAILERFRTANGGKKITTLSREKLAEMLGQLPPFAARNWLKTLRGLMQFAKRIGLRPDDPTEGIKPVEATAGTIHTWTEDEIAIFERHHAAGTRARLAMALLLFTAARRGDAVLLGPQHIRGGRLSYRQQKTGRTLAIPVHPDLAEIIRAAPPVHLTFLVAAGGKPFSAAGFGNWFRQMCDEAGLPHCSAHGLRKAQARRLAEAGCTVHEIAAITGHKTLSEVQRYTQAVEQSKLADAAISRTLCPRELREVVHPGSNPLR